MQQHRDGARARDKRGAAEPRPLFRAAQPVRRKKLFRAKGSVGGPGCPLSLHVLGRFAIFARMLPVLGVVVDFQLRTRRGVSLFSRPGNGRLPPREAACSCVAE